ncbi:MAG: ABC transporter permease [Spirochaetaceae bacterium]|nr:ABC transporter permease [Spirochaetaceae bacterium]
MKYVIKKSIVLIVTMLFISMLAFAAFNIIPGDPTTKLLGVEYTEEAAEALRNDLGLNDSLVRRYTRWLSGFVTGNLGMSYSYFLPVRDILRGKIAVTFTCSFIAWIFVIVLGIGFGILTVRVKPVFQKCIHFFTQITMSVPSFFLSILFAYFFGIVLKIFTPGKFISFEENIFKSILCMILPALAIAIPKASKVTRLLHASITSELQKDYVRTAYSRGNSRRSAIYNHVLKNALFPSITYIAMSLADMAAGSVIVEQIFVLPGLGRLLLSSIGNRDYPVAQSIIVIIAFVVVFMNYLADILTQLLDPRIRLG